jgi:hypothetical protein
MTVASPTPAAPEASVTPARLMDTPLPDLLAELDVSLSVIPIEDPTFCGYILARGERVDTVVVSSAWSELVQDSMARAMLGVALRVPLPPLPEPFAVTEL